MDTFSAEAMNTDHVPFGDAASTVRLGMEFAFHFIILMI